MYSPTLVRPILPSPYLLSTILPSLPPLPLLPTLPPYPSSLPRPTPHPTLQLSPIPQQRFSANECSWSSRDHQTLQKDEETSGELAEHYTHCLNPTLHAWESGNETITMRCCLISPSLPLSFPPPPFLSSHPYLLPPILAVIRPHLHGVCPLQQARQNRRNNIPSSSSSGQGYWPDGVSP